MNLGHGFSVDARVLFRMPFFNTSLIPTFLFQVICWFRSLQVIHTVYF